MNVRRYFRLLLVLGLLAAASGVVVAQKGPGEGDRVSVTENLDVKVQSKVIESLTRGDVVTVEQISGDWLWVRTSSGKKGWVPKGSVGKAVVPSGPAGSRSGGSGTLKPELAASGKRYAFLVGINEYQHDKLKKLAYAENDVQDMAKLLKSYGYEVVVLTGSAKAEADQGTKANIEQRLGDLTRKCQKGDTILAGFAGHGLQFEGQKDVFFCPTDARPFKDETKTLVSLTGIYEQLQKSFAGMKVLLVDACRDDPEAGRGSRGIDADTAPRPPQGVAALFSCRAGERAWEHKKYGHGVFFHHVLEGLKGEARDRDNEITFAGLSSYVSKRVSQEVPILIGEGAQQSPNLKADYSTEPVLARLTPVETPTRPLPKPMPDPLPLGNAPALLIAPYDQATALRKQQEWARYLGKKSHVEKYSIGMEMVLIPAGEYLRGSDGSDKEANDEEKPRHKVRITKPFWMGKTEVTQGEWKAVMGTEPWKRRKTAKEGDDYPATYVSWDDAQDFLKKLNEKEGGAKYRLPTEAEWEYACRAGTTTRWSFGDDASSLGDYAWYGGYLGNGNAKDEPYAHRVGQKRPNGFGLSDMHGNVSEWCLECFDELEYQRYASESAVDPQGASSGSLRVYRGGSWHYPGLYCRSAYRSKSLPTNRSFVLGFRVVREENARTLPVPKASEKLPELLIAPFNQATALKKQQEWAKYLGKSSHVEKNSLGMEMVLIPPGEYLRGSSDSEIDKTLSEYKSEYKDAKREHFSDEQPRHRVRIAKPFWLGKTEVTQAQWKAVMGTEPWKGKSNVKEGDDYPATYVSWDDAQEFVKKLNAKEEGAKYCLPTEAEWEHACRAGTSTRWSFGDDASDLGDSAWFEKNAWDIDEKYAHCVGQKRSNAFGLSDIHGNVFEWCLDWYDEKEYQRYESELAVDPSGASSGSFRVYRGGSWSGSSWNCRSAYRSWNSPGVRFLNLGFRVAQVPSSK